MDVADTIVIVSSDDILCRLTHVVGCIESLVEKDEHNGIAIMIIVAASAASR